MDFLVGITLSLVAVLIISAVQRWLLRKVPLGAYLAITAVVLWGILLIALKEEPGVPFVKCLLFFAVEIAWAVGIYYVGLWMMKLMSYPLRVTKGALIVAKGRADSLASVADRHQ